MRRLLLWMSALIAALAVLLAAAPHANATEGAHQATGLQAGQAAPFDGLLVPADQARKALRCLRVDLRACEADLALSEDRREAEAELSRRRIEVLEQANKTLDDALQSTPPCPPTPAGTSTWRDSPALWVGLGVAAGVVSTLIVTGALDIAQ